MFPKERYQYSEKSNDSQQENNVGAHVTNGVKVDSVGGDEVDDMNDDVFIMKDCGWSELMDGINECASLAPNGSDSTDTDDIDAEIFLSTFKDEPQQSSSDDSDPVYDDGD